MLDGLTNISRLICRSLPNAFACQYRAMFSRGTCLSTSLGRSRLLSATAPSKELELRQMQQRAGWGYVVGHINSTLSQL